MWLTLVTGPSAYKPELLRRLTLGLIDPANAGKLHAVWLPPVTGVLFYVHAILGFQLLGHRLRWVRRKVIWEVAFFILGIAAIAQLLILFYG
ncbi:MAG: hypothetical protein ACP5GX_05165, partial [Anaerolineae bacterium]